MLKRRRPPLLEHETQEQEYWLSYSDLMAGLLMVFVLMLFSALQHYQRQVTGVRELMEVRQRIAASLAGAFEQNPSVNVEVDSLTGVVRLEDQVLFDQGSAILRDEGRDQLALFATGYFKTLFEDQPFLEQLDEIIIEGHTNDDGSYMYNLELSQDRAYAVMEFLLSRPELNAERLKEYVTANGRSYSRLIRHPDGSVDKERSRRIEIRFRLKDEQVIRDILQRLRAG